ncbi:thrombospondin type 3 repeat-containing protein [Pelagicoccus sp. SDUM812003]|uniref:thrombospondin type 3 repeat-containing protein n=1 Tax=Pelagicoccus sp. SDUM812003 TaxID=3041267 RepID=UPI00280FC928|nr:thrombospondin type 3 repeat-containing protein [Pelagicoccus sp. SDUM812003]MDQ8202388.1 thrombospondin type 3 repeat-containing protein [Pelagicoccus sp. SDUM812003]
MPPTLHRPSDKGLAVRLRLLALILFVPVSLMRAQDDIEILDVSIPEDETMRIDFVDRDQVNSNYSLLTVVDLSASIAAWSLLEDAELEAFETFFRFEVALEADPQRFFRVISFGDASDIDGDGLTNTEEEQLGTNVYVADTDGDGFSDGTEVEYGTDPLDAESKPDISVLPTISFSSDDIASYDESAGSVFIDLVSSDSAFSGIVHYQISTLSSLDAGDHASLSGIVELENGSGRIELILTDDQVVEDVETVVVDLVPSEAGLYRLAYPERAIVVVQDNDSYWVMRLLDEDGNETSMRALLQRGSSGASGILIGSEGAAEAKEFGGSLAEGDWPLNVTWTETEFSAQSGQIPLGSSLLIDAELQRQFSFEATPPLNAEDPERAYLMERNRIIGEVVEKVTSVGGESTYLNSETRHLFVMIRAASSIEKGVIPVVEGD